MSKYVFGPDAKLEYNIIMENNPGSKNPYTIKIPTTDKKALRNPQVTMPMDIGNNTIRNPFVIPGLRKVNVDSNLNPNYSREKITIPSYGMCICRSTGFRFEMIFMYSCKQYKEAIKLI